MPDVALFALDSGKVFAERVAARLGIALGRHEERSFEDGEHKARPLESVRGKDVFVVQSLYGDDALSVNDKLCRTLFLLGALRDASAGRVTAVTPYLCYARKDRRTKPRDPVTSRYVAVLFEALGVDGMVVMDVHNPAAFENAFRCPTEHLQARRLFVDHLAPRLTRNDVVVVSPDVGGVKRAEALREDLAVVLGRPVSNAFVEKRRSEGIVSGDALVGDVAGKTVVIVDDLISSGTTLARAASACRSRGAARVAAVAAHGLFVKDADAVLGDAEIDEIVITDSVPPFRLRSPKVLSKLTVLDASSFIAEAIRRIHGGGSIVELLTPQRP